MSDEPRYMSIVHHYEGALEAHREGARAVNWKSERDAAIRYAVMLGLIRPTDPRPATLLDFGCGLGDLLDHMRRAGYADIGYAGLDISPKFLERARARFPDVDFYCGDLLRDELSLPVFDYVVMNGVFTRRHDLSHGEMLDYLRRLLERAFALARIGLAFNVMAKNVDYEGEGLFHLSYDEAARVLTESLSRHFVVRADYGLYEYTCYVYREPSQRM